MKQDRKVLKSEQKQNWNTSGNILTYSKKVIQNTEKPI